MKPKPLWMRALRAREAEKNMGPAARLALVRLLRKCGQDVDLVTIHAWPRELQGRAYLWAIDRLETGVDVAFPWLPM